MLTDARILGPRLAGLAAGPDARIVPLHLADAAVLDLIRSGDVVDVLGAPSAGSDAAPRLLAANAIVVLVSAKPNTAGAATIGWFWWPARCGRERPGRCHTGADRHAHDPLSPPCAR